MSRPALRERRHLVPVALLTATMAAAMLGSPAAGSAHDAPMADLPPIQLPDHADPVLPE